ncbi:MAG: primase [Patescibacteria group bacterium]|nr:primase [Patescibacteria group bacterium]
MDEVAEVKSRLEIVEVVGAYVPLKQAGRNLKAPCPFHQEKSASFMVSPEKGIYHCFGCGEGGDIFNFVMKMEGVDFRQALEMLARKAGVELKERKGEDGSAKKLRARLFEAHELAVKYFQASLVQNVKALEYVVKKRKLTRETIRDFQIGYAPDSWEALTGFLLKKGFTQAELLQGGLAGQKEGRSTVYDLFRGRIMFTICDREGRPVGFTGRVLDDSVPKYLNTPQTMLYDKSQAIFGFHLAREAIRSQDEVVLVEGQMDVVASHQAGVKQVVAASGTALTLDQLRMLSKLTKNIKLSFDSDRAGLAATERAIEMGQKLGLTLRMAEMPEGFKDADELILQQGVEAWKAAIAGAKYIVDYLFDRFAQDFDLGSAVGKRGYTDRLAANLRRLGDPVEQDHYVKLLAEKTGTSEEAVKSKLDSATNTISEPSVKSSGLESGRRAVVQATGKPTMRVLHEESFLALNLCHIFCRASLSDLVPGRFSSEERRGVFELLQKHQLAAGEAIAAKAGDLESYVKKLLLVGEEEFAGMEEMKLQQDAFAVARKVFLESNREYKDRLNVAIRAAEQEGDEGLRKKLLDKYKAVIDSEAAPQL